MKEIQTVHIIGMGALGMLYADIIGTNIGAEHVAFILDDERYERHMEKTYHVNHVEKSFQKIRAAEAVPCDLLIVAVKSTGLEAALDTMQNSIGENTMIISVMNGITSEEIIGARYGMHRIIHTVALGMDAMHFGDDLVYTKVGQLCIGVDDTAKTAMLEQFTAFLNRAGIQYTIDRDIKHRLWSKFMINVGINQTCMVYGTGYGGALEPASEANMVFISAMREVILLANAEGVMLTEQDMLDFIALMQTFDPKATPSMGQDRINGRKSEVELFAGTVIRLAQKHDLPVPVNAYLYRRVAEIEAAYEK